MRHYRSFSVVLLAAAAAFFFFAGQATAANLCKDASYGPLCRSLVKGNKDASAASEAIVQNLIVQTTNAKTRTARLKDQQTDVCAENYDSALDSLNKSLNYLKANDKAGFDTEVSAAISYYETCEDAYREFGVNSPLRDADTLMEHVADTILSVHKLVA